MVAATRRLGDSAPSNGFKFFEAPSTSNAWNIYLVPGLYDDLGIKMAFGSAGIGYGLVEIKAGHQIQAIHHRGMETARLVQTSTGAFYNSILKMNEAGTVNILVMNDAITDIYYELTITVYQVAAASQCFLHWRRWEVKDI